MLQERFVQVGFDGITLIIAHEVGVQQVAFRGADADGEDFQASRLRRLGRFQQMGGHRHVVGLPQEIEQSGQERMEERRQHHESASSPRHLHRARQPAADKRCDHRRGNEAPPEVVEDLPVGDC